MVTNQAHCCAQRKNENIKQKEGDTQAGKPFQGGYHLRCLQYEHRLGKCNKSRKQTYQRSQNVSSQSEEKTKQRRGESGNESNACVLSSRLLWAPVDIVRYIHLGALAGVTQLKSHQCFFLLLACRNCGWRRQDGFGSWKTSTKPGWGRNILGNLQRNYCFGAFQKTLVCFERVYIKKTRHVAICSCTTYPDMVLSRCENSTAAARTRQGRFALENWS